MGEGKRGGLGEFIWGEKASWLSQENTWGKGDSQEEAIGYNGDNGTSCRGICMFGEEGH